MILQNIVMVIGFIGLGSLIKKSSMFPENTSEVLNKFILNISLPAIILISIPHLKINMEMIVPVGLHWVAIIINILFIFLISRWLKFSKMTLGVLIIVSCLGNTAFLGIPMVETFFGKDAVPYAVLYDQLGSGIAYIIMGTFVLPLFTDKKTDSIKSVLIGLLKFPPFVALACGFLLKLFPLPLVLNNFFGSLAATLIPCAMISVGFQMKYKLPKTTMLPLVMGLWIKLLVVPLFILFIIKFFGMTSVAAKVSVLQAGMPPMITAGAMAMDANMDRDLTASLVGYGLIFSFISLSLLNYLL